MSPSRVPSGSAPSPTSRAATTLASSTTACSPPASFGTSTGDTCVSQTADTAMTAAHTAASADIIQTDWMTFPRRCPVRPPRRSSTRHTTRRYHIPPPSLPHVTCHRDGRRSHPPHARPHHSHCPRHSPLRRPPHDKPVPPHRAIQTSSQA